MQSKSVRCDAAQELYRRWFPAPSPYRAPQGPGSAAPAPPAGRGRHCALSAASPPPPPRSSAGLKAVSRHLVLRIHSSLTRHNRILVLLESLSSITALENLQLPTKDGRLHTVVISKKTPWSYSFPWCPNTKAEVEIIKAKIITSEQSEERKFSIMNWFLHLFASM